MPNFQVEVPHEMQRDQAAKKLRDFSEQARSQMPAEISDLEESWDDEDNLSFSFKALGFKVSGAMVSQTENVVVSGNLPFAALPFRGMIEAQLVERIRSALA
jgi:hypothetical protein